MTDTLIYIIGTVANGRGYSCPSYSYSHCGMHQVKKKVVTNLCFCFYKEQLLFCDQHKEDVIADYLVADCIIIMLYEV